eukprot:Amastigsp_a845057_11.p3 type:complete len:250 gc:universal Amastigsp_a845057_11:1455-706(-)
MPPVLASGAKPPAAQTMSNHSRAFERSSKFRIGALLRSLSAGSGPKLMLAPQCAPSFCRGVICTGTACLTSTRHACPEFLGSWSSTSKTSERRTGKLSTSSKRLAHGAALHDARGNDVSATMWIRGRRLRSPDATLIAPARPMPTSTNAQRVPRSCDAREMANAAKCWNTLTAGARRPSGFEGCSPRDSRSATAVRTRRTVVLLAEKTKILSVGMHGVRRLTAIDSGRGDARAGRVNCTHVPPRSPRPR